MVGVNSSYSSGGGGGGRGGMDQQFMAGKDNTSLKEEGGQQFLVRVRGVVDQQFMAWGLNRSWSKNGLAPSLCVETDRKIENITSPHTMYVLGKKWHSLRSTTSFY